MRSKLQSRLAAALPSDVELSDATLDHLPMPDQSFDAVVSTLVLCSVPDLAQALGEICRVLVLGGQLVFLEHVAAEDRPDRLKWQRRVEPLWKALAGNCHLTRRTEPAITRAGLDIVQIERESIRKAMPLARPSIRGIAVRST
jgi:ubiquinone/menaquinone biosynthesis C-methylase UbiE